MSIKYNIVKKKKKFNRLENKNYFSNLINYNTSIKNKGKQEKKINWKIIFLIIISIIIMISLKYYFNL